MVVKIQRVMFLHFLALLVFLMQCHGHSTAQTSKEAAVLRLEPRIFFELDKADITQPQIIKNNAEWLLSHPEQVIVLEGHCDELGGEDYNLELGDKRARRVMQALMARGVPETQMVIVSHGKKRPMNAAHHPDGWQENRRVEFIAR